MRALFLFCTVSFLTAIAANTSHAIASVDLAGVTPVGGGLLRVQGSAGSGVFGVPVAGGHDLDDDGKIDGAFAAMVADPLGRTNAGEVYVVFGRGQIQGEFDSANPNGDLLKIVGAGTNENAGSELWMDDVTGDGIGDLLIARQNFTPSVDRPGAGALSIVVGGEALRAFAASGAVFDLANPPNEIRVFTLVGVDAVDRLGIWMRTGDVTGDQIADIVVGADQEDLAGEANRGAAYLVRGGGHLAETRSVDLAGFGAATLEGNVLRILPASGSAGFHLGATCQIADLDDNGLSEVLLAATLSRAGASLVPVGNPGGTEASGGTANGTLFILWDDCFTPWVGGATLDLGSPGCGATTIDGGHANRTFGEEILGGLDFDADGSSDLFVGDLTGDASPFSTRSFSGVGHVFYGAHALKGASFVLDFAPLDLTITTFLGGESNDIAADTAIQGDFNRDGIDDLAFSSPHAARFGRRNAGALHVFLGREGPWPAVVDLRSGNEPPESEIAILEVVGAHGEDGTDSGDTLSYSGAPADWDGDGRTDIVTNEMLGNGATAGAVDTGNFIVLSGRLLFPVSPIPLLPVGAVGLFAGLLGIAGIARLVRARL